MILDYCPRCTRKVVLQQVTKDYHTSDGENTVKDVEQIICNICRVTVSLVTENQELHADLKKFHDMIKQQNSTPTYASYR